MIADIRNPWLRRPLCVIAAAIYLPLEAGAGAAGALGRAWIDVRVAWRGPTRHV